MTVQRASVCRRTCVWGRVTKLALIYCLCQGGCKKEAQLPNLHKYTCPCAFLSASALSLPSAACSSFTPTSAREKRRLTAMYLTENELTRECKWRRLFEVRWIYAAALLDQMSTYPAALQQLTLCLSLSFTHSLSRSHLIELVANL